MSSAAILAVLAGLALTDCRTQPGIASYVGDSRLTDNEVEQLVTTIETDVKNGGGALEKEAYGNIRQLVVQLTVFTEIAKRYAAEKGLTLPEQDYEAAAQQFGLPVTDPFVKLAVDSDSYRNLLLENAAAGERRRRPTCATRTTGSSPPACRRSAFEQLKGRVGGATADTQWGRPAQ